MRQTVLITGATGLIGERLTALFLNENYTVHYFTRDPHKVKNEEHYKGFLWNIEARTLDEKAFDGVTTIIHLAGASIAQRWTTANKERIMESRIAPMQMMYSALEKTDHDVEHFISASGINVYPSSPTKLYAEEEQERNDNFITSVVDAWEEQASRFKNLGMEVSKVRTGMVLAKEGGVLPTLIKPIKFGFGSPFGSGEQWQSWIHIDDIVGIYFFLTDKNMEGIFNAVAPNPVKNKKLVKLIAKKLHKHLWLPNVPEFALKLILGEMGSLPVESQLVSANKIRQVGYHFQHPNLEPALDDLIQ